MRARLAIIPLSLPLTVVLLACALFAPAAARAYPTTFGRVAHNPADALARCMGVQEIIFDCRAWFGGGGARTLSRYSACEPGEKVDDTTAHRNYVHLGLTKRGAAKRTSYWTRVAPPESSRIRCWTASPGAGRRAARGASRSR